MSPFLDDGIVWMNGRLVPWKDATIYIADEVFFTGSAAEVTPIRSVDKIPVGSGKRGPMTAGVQQAFFDIIAGRREDVRRWLTVVPLKI